MRDPQKSKIKQATCCARKGFTYIAESFDLIKIGSASRVERRIQALRMASAAPIKLLAVANGKDLERLLHRVCARCRDHGEWFHSDAWKFIRPLFEQECCASCAIVSLAPNVLSMRALGAKDARDLIGCLIPIAPRPIEFEPFEPATRMRRIRKSPTTPTTQCEIPVGTHHTQRRQRIRTRIQIAANGKRIVIPA